MSRASFNELLIEEVAKRPLLWDASLIDCRKATDMIALWEEIKEALQIVDPGVTLEEVQYRWRHLKDMYQMKLKDLKDETSIGSSSKSKSKHWPYMKLMRFMSDRMEPRQ
ncbi:hypothetical protein HPB49_007453 [Dermacentor silvarum]|uniref:Uncharacterized protein n=1 Tax=Dermacentor silvarum TaxID=543639 RepID=A0ACB8DWF0_DERSI|nr:hypothetical protein HPB49_007453 [Dermacentor silvarum]